MVPKCNLQIGESILGRPIYDGKISLEPLGATFLVASGRRNIQDELFAARRVFGIVTTVVVKLASASASLVANVHRILRYGSGGKPHGAGSGRSGRVVVIVVLGVVATASRDDDGRKRKSRLRSNRR